MPVNRVACDVAGRVARVAAAVGTAVSSGDPLLVVDTADAEVSLDAPLAGTVTALFFAPDDIVPEAAIVATIEG